MLTPGQVFCRLVGVPAVVPGRWVGGWRQRRTRAFSAAKRLLLGPGTTPLCCCVGRTVVCRLQHATQVCTATADCESKGWETVCISRHGAGCLGMSCVGCIRKRRFMVWIRHDQHGECAWGDSHQQINRHGDALSCTLGRCRRPSFCTFVHIKDMHNNNVHLTINNQATTTLHIQGHKVTHRLFSVQGRKGLGCSSSPSRRFLCQPIQPIPPSRPYPCVHQAKGRHCACSHVSAASILNWGLLDKCGC